MTQGIQMDMRVPSGNLRIYWDYCVLLDSWYLPSDWD